MRLFLLYFNLKSVISNAYTKRRHTFTKGLVIGQTWLLHLIACALVLVCSLVVLSEPIVKAAKKKAASKQ